MHSSSTSTKSNIVLVLTRTRGGSYSYRAAAERVRVLLVRLLGSTTSYARRLVPFVAGAWRCRRA